MAIATLKKRESTPVISDDLIDIEGVAALCQRGKSTINRLRSQPAKRFPKPIRSLGNRNQVWRRGDVLNWLAQAK